MDSLISLIISASKVQFPCQPMLLTVVLCTPVLSVLLQSESFTGDGDGEVEGGWIRGVEDWEKTDGEREREIREKLLLVVDNHYREYEVLQSDPFFSSGWCTMYCPLSIFAVFTPHPLCKVNPPQWGTHGTQDESLRVPYFLRLSLLYGRYMVQARTQPHAKGVQFYISDTSPSYNNYAKHKILCMADNTPSIW